MPVDPLGSREIEIPISPECLPGSRRPAPSLWSWRDLGLFTGFAIGWLLGSYFLTTSAYTLLKPVFGWRAPVAALVNNTFFVVATQIVFYAPLLAYIRYLVVEQYGLRFWAAFNRRRFSAASLLAFFVSGVVLAVVAAHVPTFLPDQENFPLAKLFSSAAAAYALAVFAVFVAPFMEELIFRGVVFNVFERQVGLWFAIIATALLFAAFHISEYSGAWNHVLVVSLAGLVFSLARGLTGSLTPSIFLHFGYNAAVMAALYSGTQHFHSLTFIASR